MAKTKWMMLFGLLMMAAGLKAEWTDITSLFVTNPGFDSNSNSGWTYDLNAQGSSVNYNCWEVFNGTFNIYQQLSGLPKGNYRLTVQAFYRAGSNEVAYPSRQNDEEPLTAVLYAGEAETALQSVYEYWFMRNQSNCWTPSGTNYRYPNGMSSAAQAFANGAYVNTLEFEANGDITIGIKNDSYINTNWCIFDNFTLEYEGSFSQVMVQNVTLSFPKTKLNVGEKMTASATVTPSNATLKTLKWETSDPFVLTVGQDGSIIARHEGTATVTATTTDGSAISRTKTITVSDNTTPDTRTWIDLTSYYLTNPDFADDGSTQGWTVSGGTVRAGCLEFWNYGQFSAYQTIYNLPAGHYRLSANGYHRFGDPDPSFERYCSNLTDAYARLFAKDQETVFPGFFDYLIEWPGYYDGWTWINNQAFPNTMETAAQAFAEGGYPVAVEFDVTDNDTEVNVGVVNDVYFNHNWFIFGNVRLEYQGTMTYVSDLQLTPTANKIQVGSTLQINAAFTPANALVRSLQWTSSDESIATVDKNGLVTGLSTGTATITATTTDGSDISRTVTVTVVREDGNAEKIVINEIMAANVDEYISPAFNFDGWVELYNPTDKPITLVGLYLSDDGNDLKKWRMPLALGELPAKGFKLVWFDSSDIAQENVSFKLNIDGGHIHLSDDEGKLICSEYYPAAIERTSYARTTDGGEEWGTTGTPTPRATNATSTFAFSQLAAPQIDQPSRLFNGAFTATAAIPAGTTLRYTLDGSLPTMTNGYTSNDGIFQISSTTTLRLRLFADGSLPSTVTTRSYIENDKDYYLPVVAVVGDNDFFYDTEIGVFEKGPNGRPGNGQSEKCNWNMNWDRPVNFSYLTADGEMVLNQDVDLEMCGGWSRAWTPHSFKLKGSKEMGGNKNLEYPFFSEKPFIRNRTLQIRNGGNDTNARLKDPALQQIVRTSGLNLDYQGYQPVHEFINGEYMGVLNIREPNNKHYVYANYGWDDDEIEQFEMSPDSGYVQKCGTPDAFNDLVDVLSADAANPETYAEICSLLDIDSYANYMAVEMYLGGTDWPQNNVKGFRLTDGGKFRFVLFDLDGTFATNTPFTEFMDKETYTFDQLYPTSLGRITDHIRFVTLFKNMLQNSDFRRRFIDAFCMMGGSVFEANRAAEIVDELQSRVATAMNMEGRLGNLNNTANSLRNNLSAGRNYTMVNAMRNYNSFDLSSTAMQIVNLSSDTEGAQLLVNDTKVPTGQFNGYLFAPARLKAVAPGGYVFQGWESPTGNSITLKGQNTLWSYYDQGSLDGQNWKSPNYTESGWKQGYAPLGYNNPNVAANTQVDYQTQKSAFYFRTKIQLTNAPENDDQFWLDYIADDGFVIYVNGTEAGRYNMPSGTVSYSTFASHYCHDNPDRGSLQLPTTLFHQGQNTIAVEVHNESTGSSDILWEASIRASQVGYYSTEAEIDLPADEQVTLVANYRPMTQAERDAQQVHPVCINEVSASNSVFINEYFKKNDWVELYNTTDEEIDVEGMYLTDNAEKPTKYQITKGETYANTKIPAHGYLIIWCDKLKTNDQGLHASYKLSADGDMLMLTAADRSWTDTLIYAPHDGNSSVGRYPDGSKDIYTMNIPTIANANMLTAYMTKVYQEQATDIAVPAIASANGFRIRYGSQTLLVKSEEAEQVTVEIYTPDGRLAESTTVQLHLGTGRLSVAHLPQGFYVARATDAQRNAVGCKFMK